MDDRDRGDDRPKERSDAASPSTPASHRRQTERHLILGGAVILVVVGGALILLFYDTGTLAGAWLCLGAMVLPIAAVMGALWAFERLGRDPSDKD